MDPGRLDRQGHRVGRGGQLCPKDPVQIELDDPDRDVVDDRGGDGVVGAVATPANRDLRDYRRVTVGRPAAVGAFGPTRKGGETADTPDPPGPIAATVAE